MNLTQLNWKGTRTDLVTVANFVKETMVKLNIEIEERCTLPFVEFGRFESPTAMGQQVGKEIRLNESLTHEVKTDVLIHELTHYYQPYREELHIDYFHRQSEIEARMVQAYYRNHTRPWFIKLTKFVSAAKICRLIAIHACHMNFAGRNGYKF